MKSLSRTLSAALLMLAPFVCSAARVKEVPLQAVSARTGTLFPASPETIGITVKDERPDERILAAGLLGRGAEKGKGSYLAYASQEPGAVARLFETAAKEAVEVLGMKPGEGGASLLITIKDFRIDTYLLSGFGAFNCVGYGLIQTILTPGGGREPLQRDFRLAYFDHTHAAVSVKEVGREALSRIYTRAAWEAAARTLLAGYPAQADHAGIQRALSSLDTSKDDDARALTVFWLGLVGKDTPNVADKLLSVFRREENQAVSQAAAVALGMLKAGGAEAELEGVLSGGKKLPEWDRTDVEQAWHLLDALARLGTADLAPKIPRTENMGTKLAHLIRFHETGVMPELSQKEREKLAEARSELKE